MNQVLHLSKFISPRIGPGLKNSFFQSVGSRRSFLTESYQSVYSSVFAPGCLPVDAISHSMYWVHNSCHLPWWATIVITSVVLRSAVVTPFQIYSTVNSYKLGQYLQSDVHQQSQQQIKNEAMLNALKKSQTKQEYQRDVALKKMDLHKKTMSKYPMYLMRSMLVQFPLWITTSFTLRNMCGHRGLMEPENAVVGFSSGGIGTFRNLLESDPTLSFLLLTLNIVNIEITSAQQSQNSKLFKFVRYLSLGGTGVMFAASFFIPAALPLFWCVSSGHQLLTRLVFMSPRTLELLNVKSISNSPYRDLFKTLKSKYSLKLSK